MLEGTSKTEPNLFLREQSIFAGQGTLTFCLYLVASAETYSTGNI